jgi:hypothetical protein
MSRNAHFRMGPMLSNSRMGTAYAPNAENAAEGDILYGLREDDANMRLGRFRAFEPNLGTAYAPNAENAAEGDILYGLREDDANLRLGVSAYDLRGLREDDANLRLGDGASGSAEGEAEGHEVEQLGISAYDLRGHQPGILRSNGRTGGMSGLREDDANIRMGVSAYDLQGLREDDANLRLGVSAYDLNGLREDDANLRLGVSAYDLRGLREDDANLRLGDDEYDQVKYRSEFDQEMRGLREDDANVRLGDDEYDQVKYRSEFDKEMGTAWAPDAAGSAEDPASRSGMGVSAYDLQGLREDDANVRLGISAYDLGDVDSLNAEAAAIEQEQVLADHELGVGKGMKIRNVARNSARIALQRAKSGAIASRAEADQFVSEKTRIAGEKMKRYLSLRRDGVDKIVNDAIEKAMAEWGPQISKVLSSKVSVQGVRMGMILRGLLEDDANIELDGMGRFRAFRPGRGHRAMRKGLRGAEGTPPEMLNATGFHERFPVTVDIAGLGRINGSVSGAHMSDLFSFLKSGPSPEEYMGKIRIVMDGWSVVQPQLNALPKATRDVIEGQMQALGNHVYKYQGMGTFLAEGPGALKQFPGRWERVKSLEAYLPTVQAMVSQARALGGNFTVDQANKTALDDLKSRQDAAGTETFLEKAAPIAAGAAGVGLLTALVIAIA